MGPFRTQAIGILLISGLTAGILAYMVSSRRPVREESVRIGTPQVVFERARELGDTEVARASREYISERVVPEMKPVLLDVLKDFESYVGHYFDRAEKAIKSM